MAIKKEIQGDLFAALEKAKADWIVIPHVCNNCHGWGAGFVVPLGKHFPEAKKSYLTTEKEYMRLGDTQIVEVEKNNKTFWIANMIAQDGFKTENKERPLNYGALVKSMYQVRDDIEEAQTDHWHEKDPTIVTVRFGSDLAGGDWNIIRELVDAIWEDYDTYVFYL